MPKSSTRNSPKTPRKYGRRIAKPKGAYHHGDLKNAIMIAALRLIDRDGTRRLSLREAARKAGVSQSAPYRHFPDREALLAAIAEQGFRELCERLSAVDTTVSARRVENLGVVYVLFALDRPSHYRVMFGADDIDTENHPGLQEAASAAFDFLETALREARDAGLTQPGDAGAFAQVAWSLVHGMASLCLDGRIPSEDIEAKVREAARLMFYGLAPR